MGKGDRKTRRGKITKGTFGVRRPHKKVTVVVKKTKPASKKEAKPAAKPKAKPTPKSKEKEVNKKEAEVVEKAEAPKKKE